MHAAVNIHFIPVGAPQHIILLSSAMSDLILQTVFHYEVDITTTTTESRACRHCIGEVDTASEKDQRPTNKTICVCRISAHSKAAEYLRSLLGPEGTRLHRKREDNHIKTDVYTELQPNFNS